MATYGAPPGSEDVTTNIHWTGFFQRVPELDPGAVAKDCFDNILPLTTGGADRVDSRRLWNTFPVNYSTVDQWGQTASCTRFVKVVL